MATGYIVLIKLDSSQLSPDEIFNKKIQPSG